MELYTHAARVTNRPRPTALAAARDAAVAAEWAFHNAVLGSKTQVDAQYGENSDQRQSLGRKKKSERARPTRRDKNKKGSGQ